MNAKKIDDYDFDNLQAEQLLAIVSGTEKFNQELTRNRKRSWIDVIQDHYFKFTPARFQQVTQKLLLVFPRVAHKVLKLSGVHHQQF